MLDLTGMLDLTSCQSHFTARSASTAATICAGAGLLPASRMSRWDAFSDNAVRAVAMRSADGWPGLSGIHLAPASACLFLLTGLAIMNACLRLSRARWQGRRRRACHSTRTSKTEPARRAGGGRGGQTGYPVDPLLRHAVVSDGRGGGDPLGRKTAPERSLLLRSFRAEVERIRRGPRNWRSAATPVS